MRVCKGTLEVIVWEVGLFLVVALFRYDFGSVGKEKVLEVWGLGVSELRGLLELFGWGWR